MDYEQALLKAMLIRTLSHTLVLLLYLIVRFLLNVFIFYILLELFDLGKKKLGLAIKLTIEIFLVRVFLLLVMLYVPLLVYSYPVRLAFYFLLIFLVVKKETSASSGEAFLFALIYLVLEIFLLGSFDLWMWGVIKP